MPVVCPRSCGRRTEQVGTYVFFGAVFGVPCLIVLAVIIPLTENPTDYFVPGIATVTNDSQVVRYTSGGVDYYRPEWSVNIVDESDNKNYTKKAATHTTSLQGATCTIEEATEFLQKYLPGQKYTVMFAPSKIVNYPYLGQLSKPSSLAFFYYDPSYFDQEHHTTLVELGVLGAILGAAALGVTIAGLVHLFVLRPQMHKLKKIVRKARNSAHTNAVIEPSEDFS
ncbi:hypothetical protein Pelo_7676 [Pelomyxa schiedti]|nr:hypothetical protein Pelo_7676 [Pelomyxa schiedti]